MGKDPKPPRGTGHRLNPYPPKNPFRRPGIKLPSEPYILEKEIKGWQEAAQKNRQTAKAGGLTKWTEIPEEEGITYHDFKDAVTIYIVPCGPRLCGQIHDVKAGTCNHGLVSWDMARRSIPALSATPPGWTFVWGFQFWGNPFNRDFPDNDSPMWLHWLPYLYEEYDDHLGRRIGKMAPNQVCGMLEHDAERIEAELKVEWYREHEPPAESSEQAGSSQQAGSAQQDPTTDDVEMKE